MLVLCSCCVMLLAVQSKSDALTDIMCSEPEHDCQQQSAVRQHAPERPVPAADRDHPERHPAGHGCNGKLLSTSRVLRPRLGSHWATAIVPNMLYPAAPGHLQVTARSQSCRVAKAKAGLAHKSSEAPDAAQMHSTPLHSTSLNDACVQSSPPVMQAPAPGPAASQPIATTPVAALLQPPVSAPVQVPCLAVPVSEPVQSPCLAIRCLEFNAEGPAASLPIPIATTPVAALLQPPVSAPVQVL